MSSSNQSSPIGEPNTRKLPWNPEDENFWAQRGQRIARRNLWISIPALHLSFAVWMLWSAVVVKMGDIGYAFTPDQMFMLAAAPGLAGATLRLPMTFVVPIFGGRTVSTFMTAALLLPTIGLGLALQNPHTSFSTFLLLGVLAGFGGGNFTPRPTVGGPMVENDYYMLRFVPGSGPVGNTDPVLQRRPRP